MKAVSEIVEIRGHEIKKGKNGDYILVRCENVVTGESYTLVSKDMTLEDKFIRGEEVHLELEISFSRGYTNVRIIGVDKTDD